MKKQVINNIERLCWILFSMFCIGFGLFIEPLRILLYLGIFIMGIIIGQLK